MKKALVFSVITVFLFTGFVSADTFGTGDNQLEIEFVTISGSTNPTSGYGIVNNDYQMGTYEITNDQWSKFTNSLGVPITGSPSYAYDGGSGPFWTGTNVPINHISWDEAAQFVNWLNTSSGHQPAYKFTGTQGTGDYTLGVWELGDTGYDPSNPFRNSNAHYFLPTEDEWVKAAYWNGTSLQTYATTNGATPIAGVDTNYNGVSLEPWNVGSGSEELNGTFDMMGNFSEWMESPYYSGDYLPGSVRVYRGGSFSYSNYYLNSAIREGTNGHGEYSAIGFRVASIPEPAMLLLLGMGSLLIRKV